MCTWINNRRRPEAFCTFALLSDCEKKLLDLKIAEHRGHIAPMLTFNTVC